MQTESLFNPRLQNYNILLRINLKLEAEKVISCIFNQNKLFLYNFNKFYNNHKFNLSPLAPHLQKIKTPSKQAFFQFWIGLILIVISFISKIRQLLHLLLSIVVLQLFFSSFLENLKFSKWLTSSLYFCVLLDIWQSLDLSPFLQPLQCFDF
jgi:hypothetical protein